jgi:hypothetical protein
MDPLPSPSAATCADRLEAGDIIVVTPPDLLAGPDLAFLRAIDRVGGSYKNIALVPRTGRLTGVHLQRDDSARLRRILATYAEQITAVVAALCPGYAACWGVDLTSFRPVEEAGRDLNGRTRNDRLHIDAFPSRPTHGSRILRVFTNVHPTRPRCWLTGDPLDRSLPALQQLPGFPRPHRQQAARLRAHIARWVGMPALGRSAYDRSMLRLHDFMKQSDAAQEQCHPIRHDFAPNTSWIVFTDTVPHAVLSGQHALEQTYFVPRRALRAPRRSPLALLEQIARGPLV